MFIIQFKKQRCVDCLPTVETCWYVMSSSDVVYPRMALTKAVQSVQVLAEAKPTKVEAKANKVVVKMEAFMLGKCSGQHTETDCSRMHNTLCENGVCPPGTYGCTWASVL